MSKKFAIAAVASLVLSASGAHAAIHPNGEAVGCWATGQDDTGKEYKGKTSFVSPYGPDEVSGKFTMNGLTLEVKFYDFGTYVEDPVTGKPTTTFFSEEGALSLYAYDASGNQIWQSGMNVPPAFKKKMNQDTGVISEISTRGTLFHAFYLVQKASDSQSLVNLTVECSINALGKK